ncbi:MAG TPA: hypothetical protein VNP93_13055 [Gaiellaceae bacterium]|nr:hypothetical protein [Gaiellaceae bacterium]
MGAGARTAGSVGVARLGTDAGGEGNGGGGGRTGGGGGSVGGGTAVVVGSGGTVTVVVTGSVGTDTVGSVTDVVGSVTDVVGTAAVAEPAMMYADAKPRLPSNAMPQARQIVRLI